MTHKEMFDEVIASGRYVGSMAKVERLAQLIYRNDTSNEKSDCVWMALEKYEDMTGFYMDPTQKQFDDILSSML